VCVCVYVCVCKPSFTDRYMHMGRIGFLNEKSRLNH
jgi:hypothetical protein